MTNEEKILDILAEISLRMDSLATKEDLSNEVLKIHIEMESDIKPKLQALAEGHSTILEQLTPRSRIDDIETELAFLKRLVTSMSAEIDQLKAV